MNRKEMITKIEAEHILTEMGNKIPEIISFKITTNEDTEVVLNIDQIDKFKLGMILEVNLVEDVKWVTLQY